MADLANNACDLCEKENCVGPIKLAHKPYVFHFYHSKQYKQALIDFQSKNIPEDDTGINDYSVNEEEGDTDKEEEEEQEEEEEEAEGEEEEESVEVGEDEEDQEEISEDEILEEDEEGEPVDNSEDNYEGDSVDENSENIEEDEEEEIEGEEEDEEETNEEIKVDEDPETKIDKHIIPVPVITSIVSDVNTLMCKTIDITMAAGVGIMAGIVSMTSGKSNEIYSAPASFINMETISKTCIGTTLAAIGMVAGIKEIINAVNEQPPDLPVCEYCNKCELQQPGCKIFCESCGECEQGSYWKNGSVNMHCLRICNDCSTNCVVCEEKVATVKRHHTAFTRNVHGKLSTRLYGTYKDARIFGSSLIIAGILTCIVPGISWSWGIGLIAGSVIANSGIRIIAKPIVRIRCDSCDLEDEAGKFEESTGCQIWCQCCGLQEGTGGERYCLALCEDCSD